MTDPAPPDQELLAAFVGKGWERHYRDSFAAAAGGGRYAFNWAATLTPLWLAYRGMWLVQLLAYLLTFGVAVLGKLLGDQIERHQPLTLELILLLLISPYVMLCVAQGLFADRLLHRRAERAVRAVRARGLDPEAELALLRRKGRGSLLKVVGVIFVTWATWVVFVMVSSMSRMHAAREGYIYKAALKSDLRNLVTAQETWFSDHNTYTSVLGPGGAEFVPSHGDSIMMGVATRTGWNATAIRYDCGPEGPCPDIVCGIFVGDAPPPVGARDEGAPYCETRKRH